RLVDDARAAVDRDEVGRHDPPGDVLAAARDEPRLGLTQRLVVIVERGNVPPAEQLAPAERLFHGQLPADFSGDRLDQGGGDDQFAALRILTVGRHGVFQVGVDGRELVAGQSPGRGRPDEQRCVWLVDQGKADVNARIGDFAVALSYFAGAKR